MSDGETRLTRPWFFKDAVQRPVFSFKDEEPTKDHERDAAEAASTGGNSNFFAPCWVCRGIVHHTNIISKLFSMYEILSNKEIT